jgi:hypothetical protein
MTFIEVSKLFAVLFQCAFKVRRSDHVRYAGASLATFLGINPGFASEAATNPSSPDPKTKKKLQKPDTHTLDQLTETGRTRRQSQLLSVSHLHYSHACKQYP